MPTYPMQQLVDLFDKHWAVVPTGRQEMIVEALGKPRHGRGFSTYTEALDHWQRRQIGPLEQRVQGSERALENHKARLQLIDDLEKAVSNPDMDIDLSSWDPNEIMHFMHDVPPHAIKGGDTGLRRHHPMLVHAHTHPHGFDGFDDAFAPYVVINGFGPIPHPYDDRGRKSQMQIDSKDLAARFKYVDFDVLRNDYNELVKRDERWLNNARRELEGADKQVPEVVYLPNEMDLPFLFEPNVDLVYKLVFPTKKNPGIYIREIKVTDANIYFLSFDKTYHICFTLSTGGELDTRDETAESIAKRGYYANYSDAEKEARAYAKRLYSEIQTWL